MIPRAPSARDPVEYRRILVPLDGSARSEDALPSAATLAKAEDAELVLCYFAPEPGLTAFGMMDQAAEQLGYQVTRRNTPAAQGHLARIKNRLAHYDLKIATSILGQGDVRRSLIDAISSEAAAGLIAAVQDYQQTAELTNAELWALPSMLRLVCIAQLVDAFAQMQPELRPAFAPEGAEGTDVDPVARTAHAITNLIAVHVIKWTDFVDSTSLIEANLLDDPAGIYPDMTFETRDRYRKVAERLARRSDLSESAVAQAAVALARDRSDDPVHAHVGYWLIGEAICTLEARVAYRVPAGLALRRAAQALRSAADQFVDPDAQLVRLLTPPFDQTDRDPGYIQAYSPGIRENGGQYTHAATWPGGRLCRHWRWCRRASGRGAGRGTLVLPDGAGSWPSRVSLASGHRVAASIPRFDLQSNRHLENSEPAIPSSTSP